MNMTLEEKLNASLKEAMKSGNKAKTSTIRLVLNEIKNKKIAEKAEKFDDAKVAGIIQKMVKQRKESIEQFEKAGRNDLVKKETEELSFLEEYMPEQIPADELEKMVTESITAAGASTMKDMGKVISLVKERVQGGADGKTISEIVKKKLGGARQ